MKILNLFKSSKGDTQAVLDQVYKTYRQKEKEQLFIYNSDNYSKSINRLFKASSGLNYNICSNTHYLAKLGNNGLILATIDGVNWFDIGIIKDKPKSQYDTYLVLVTKPDKKYSYNKSGYNFYLKCY